MRHFSVSEKILCGLLGLVICHSLSFYFFWNSQTPILGFQLDPENSIFSNFLSDHLRVGILEETIVGALAWMAAFISIHLSWILRNVAGYPAVIVCRQYKERLNLNVDDSANKNSASRDCIAPQTKPSDMSIYSFTSDDTNNVIYFKNYKKNNSVNARKSC